MLMAGPGSGSTSERLPTDVGIGFHLLKLEATHD